MCYTFLEQQVNKVNVVTTRKKQPQGGQTYLIGGRCNSVIRTHRRIEVTIGTPQQRDPPREETWGRDTGYDHTPPLEKEARART